MQPCDDRYRETRRRHVIKLIASVCLTKAPNAIAQQRLLGALTPFVGDAPDAGLRKWLRDFNYPEAESQEILALGSNGNDELLPKLAVDLVARKPAVILAWGDAAARAAQAATKSIPIVVMTDDLAGAGLVASMSRPGGNLTGVNVLATELDAKRLEFLALIVPARSTVMVLADAVSPPLSRPGLRRTASELGLTLVEEIARTRQDMERLLLGARRRGIAGVNILASPVFFSYSDDLIAWTNAARLPAIFEWGFLADVGALIGYGPLFEPLYRRLINQVMGLLRGGKVADFPVEQPTLFELVVNLKTAKASGIEIPALLMLRADRVIR